MTMKRTRGRIIEYANYLVRICAWANTCTLVLSFLDRLETSEYLDKVTFMACLCDESLLSEASECCLSIFAAWPSRLTLKISALAGERNSILINWIIREELAASDVKSALRKASVAA